MPRGKKVTEPQLLGRRFYVAMNPTHPDKGSASCVDDDLQTVREFFRDYAGREIRHVDGDEMQRLMTN